MTPLFCRIKSPIFDIQQMLKSYHDHISKFEPTKYKDNNADYAGWALLNSSGQSSDDVKYLHKSKAKPTNKFFTEACDDNFKSIIQNLREDGFSPFRCRIMKLLNDTDKKMNWHVDSKKEHSWRIHIPFVTTINSLFQWRSGGKIYSHHLPADGCAYAVRVDIEHRAINPSKDDRIHFLCGTEKVFLESSKTIEVLQWL